MKQLSLVQVVPDLLCYILITNNSQLLIIPRAQMGYESIAHEAEGRMGC